MKIKPGVKIGGVQPEIVLALVLMEPVFEQFAATLTVTSLLDGKHSAKSLHYSGKAADIRTRDIPADRLAKLVPACREALGPEFDVVLESDHIHLEFDPKESK